MLSRKVVFKGEGAEIVTVPEQNSGSPPPNNEILIREMIKGEADTDHNNQLMMQETLQKCIDATTKKLVEQVKD